MLAGAVIINEAPGCVSGFLVSVEETFKDRQIRCSEGQSLCSVSKDPDRYPHMCHLVQAVDQSFLNDCMYMHLFPVDFLLRVEW